jgi:hypothetical protein
MRCCKGNQKEKGKEDWRFGVRKERVKCVVGIVSWPMIKIIISLACILVRVEPSRRDYHLLPT